MKFKISVIIPTYNCNQYLPKALKSVLENSIDEKLMEILVVDDCSDESPEEIVKKLGGNRVKFFRNETNLGHVKNFNSAILKSDGEIIHILHGDDFVHPGFYKEILETYKEFPDIGACFCRHFFVDDQDDVIYISDLLSSKRIVLTDFYEKLIFGQCIQTPSITVARATYEKVGLFNEDLSWCEDWEMWFRISLQFKIGYTQSPLASYRIHSNSSTGKKVLTGENLMDLERIKVIFKEKINVNLLKEFEKNFKRILRDTAISNYSKSIQNNYFEYYIHLKYISKYSDNWIDKMKNILKYYVKKWM